MSVNPYFSNFPNTNSSEQNLVEDLIGETIKIHGVDCYYIVRESILGSEIDLIYGENPASKFSKFFILEMYLDSTMSNVSGGSFASNLGLQINESITLQVTRRTFQKWVPSDVAPRPREGDLIYVPFSTNLYEIKNVDNEKNYYTLGRSGNLPYMYEMSCELFKHSQESLSTGITDIDEIELEGSYTIELQLNPASSNGSFYLNELVFQGGSYKNAVAVAEVKGWLPEARKLKIANIRGEFANTGNVRGVTSGTTYNITNYDPLEDHTNFNESQNSLIEIEVDSFIDNTENNPFGKI